MWIDLLIPPGMFLLVRFGQMGHTNGDVPGLSVPGTAFATGVQSTCCCECSIGLTACMFCSNVQHLYIGKQLSLHDKEVIIIWRLDWCSLRFSTLNPTRLPCLFFF